MSIDVTNYIVATISKTRKWNFYMAAEDVDQFNKTKEIRINYYMPHK